MAIYNVNQRVEAIVERIFPFGVFVRLPDGTEAYIRRRELDLDADVDPGQVVHKEERIDAVVISLDGKHIELSRRLTLPNPWSNFLRRFSEGDVIQGTVRALHPRGVFVRIQAGINGFVPLTELAPQSEKDTNDFLWVGDDVEAIITHIIPGKKQVSLSIIARLEQLKQVADVAGEFTPQSQNIHSFVAMEEFVDTKKIIIEDFQEAGPIYIVEDNNSVRVSLQTWLSERKIQVYTATTSSQALEIPPASVKIFIIDLNLPDGDGLNLIQHFRENNRSSYMCVMSTPNDLADRAEEIQASRVVQVFSKPLDMDDLKRFLSQVASGEKLTYWQHDGTKSQKRQMAEILHSSEMPLDVQIRSALNEITDLVQAQVGLLFRQDQTSKEISIAFQAGQYPLNQEALYGLRESPVKDVIVSGQPIIENHVKSNTPTKYAKLTDLIEFQSCIGIPIPVWNEIHHAVFFLHFEEDAFSRYRLKDAQCGGLLLSALLSDQLIRERVLALNPMLLSGELAASFGHEVSNKITALELEAQNSIDIGKGDKERFQRILSLIIDLKNTAQAFQQLLKKEERTERIQVNDLMLRCIQLLSPIARKEKVNLITKLTPELPPFQGKSIFLQQAVINIMLNAIQQMAIKTEKYGWKGKHVLEISTVLNNDLIQIRFEDNGPGIHKQHLGRLFTPGFSTRGGSGLGLYIAHGFVRKLGGSLSVEKTFVPLGTSFLLEFSIANQEKLND